MNPLLSWFSKIFLKPIVDKLLIKEVKGLENLPKTNFILVSNHQSYLDIIIDSYLCVPRRFHFIGQIEGFKIPLRWLIAALYFLSGVIPLNRKDEESRAGVVKSAIEVLKKGDILIIYPEGARSRNGQIQEGKAGVARIFLKTGVPVLPAAIKGTFDLLPPKGKLKVKRIVKINIGKPLYFKEEFEKAKRIEESSNGYKEILQKITDKIMEEVSNLYQET